MASTRLPPITGAKASEPSASISASRVSTSTRASERPSALPGALPRKEATAQPASAPAAQNGLTESTEKKSVWELSELLYRDDENRTLQELMVEEDIVPADLIKLKKTFEEHGKWKWEPPPLVQRLQRAIAHAHTHTHTVAHMLPEAAAAARLGELSGEFKAKAAPKEIRCTWRLTDASGSVFACMNEVLRHPARRVLMRVCAFHVTLCVMCEGDGRGGGALSDVQPVRRPNNCGLCVAHYQALRGHEPVEFADAGSVPGVVCVITHTRTHELAPSTEPLSKKKAQRRRARGDDDEDEPGMLEYVDDREDAFEVVGSRQPMVLTPARTMAGNIKRGAAAVGEVLGKVVESTRTFLVGDFSDDEEAFLGEGAREKKPRSKDDSAAQDAAVASKKDATSRASARSTRSSSRTGPARHGEPRKRRFNMDRFIPGQASRRRHTAAACIQAAVRRHFARRAVAYVRAKRARDRRNAAARVIQRFSRVIAARAEFRAMFMRHQRAALQVQTWFRMRMLIRALALDRRRHMAAVTIQRAFRTARMRILMHVLYQRVHAHVFSSAIAAAMSVIGKLVRAWRTKMLVKHVAKFSRRVKWAVGVLQRSCRRWAAVKFRQQLITEGVIKPPEVTAEEVRAARVIARACRRYRLRVNMRAVRREMMDAAATINRFVRQVLVRLHAVDVDVLRENVRQLMAPSMNPREFRALVEKPLTRGRSRRGSATSQSSFLSGTSGRRRSIDTGASAGRRSIDSDEKPVQATGRQVGSRSRSARRSSLTSSIGSVSVFSGSRGSSRPAQATTESAVARFRRIFARSKEQHRRQQQGTARAGTERARSAMDDSIRKNTKEYQAISRYVSSIAAAFERIDRIGTGYVSRPTFTRVMRSVGYEAPHHLIRKLQDAFITAGDRFDYRRYVEFLRSLRYMCPVHRVLVCPMCLYLGSCACCSCTAFKKDRSMSKDLWQRRAKLCECGHHEYRHVPLMRVHDEVSVPPASSFVHLHAAPRASSKTQALAGALFVDGINAGLAQRAFRIDGPTAVHEVRERATATVTAAAVELSRSTSLWDEARREDITLPRQSVLKDALARMHAGSAALATVSAPPSSPRSPKPASDSAPSSAAPSIATATAQKWNALDAWLDDIDNDEVPPNVPKPEPSSTSAATMSSDRHFSQSARSPPTTSSGTLPTSTAPPPTPVQTYVQRNHLHPQPPYRGSLAAPRVPLHEREAAVTLRVAASAPTLSQTERTLAAQTLQYLEALSMTQLDPSHAEEDVVGNVERISEVSTRFHAVLGLHWPDIVRDVMYGTVRGGPPGLTPLQRTELERDMHPQPARAEYLESVFRTIFPVRPAETALPVLLHNRGASKRAHPRFGKDPVRPLGTAPQKSPYLAQPTSLPAARATRPRLPSTHTDTSPRAGGTSATAAKPTFAVSMFSLAPAPDVPPPHPAPAYPYGWRDDLRAKGPVEVDAGGAASAVGAALMCPYPGCGRQASSSTALREHLARHRSAPKLQVAAAADAYLAPLWKGTALEGIIHAK